MGQREMEGGKRSEGRKEGGCLHSLLFLFAIFFFLLYSLRCLPLHPPSSACSWLCCSLLHGSCYLVLAHSCCPVWGPEKLRSCLSHGSLVPGVLSSCLSQSSWSPCQPVLAPLRDLQVPALGSESRWDWRVLGAP